MLSISATDLFTSMVRSLPALFLLGAPLLAVVIAFAALLDVKIPLVARASGAASH